MKNLMFLLLSVTCCTTLLAQEKSFSVFGKVIDAETKQPMPGASAYCQNTTQGTVSNNQGLFYMHLPNGGYDMVVTYTGYEKKVFRISNTQPQTDTLLVELAKADQSLSEVAVVASTEDPEGLTKYGKFFSENFIGNTGFANQCTIQNPEVLKFYYSKKRNRLKIMAKEDLIIFNYALGYKIRYQLDSFSYDYSSSITQYTGSPLFQEMDSTEEVKTQWKKNRGRTYLGSRLHFMRSFYDSTVAKEGFIVEKLNDIPKVQRAHLLPISPDPGTSIVADARISGCIRGVSMSSRPGIRRMASSSRSSPSKRRRARGTARGARRHGRRRPARVRVKGGSDVGQPVRGERLLGQAPVNVAVELPDQQQVLAHECGDVLLPGAAEPERHVQQHVTRTAAGRRQPPAPRSPPGRGVGGSELEPHGLAAVVVGLDAIARRDEVDEFQTSTRRGLRCRSPRRAGSWALLSLTPTWTPAGVASTVSSITVRACRIALVTSSLTSRVAESSSSGRPTSASASLTTARACRALSGTGSRRTCRSTTPGRALDVTFLLSTGALAKVLKSGGNLILLDEPTNDLDVETLRALEEALLSFPGCAVVISHDRWFLDRIATHILAFEGNSEVVWFEGNYAEYAEDLKRRKGDDADSPHRIRYKKLEM